jgi:plastocyanin
MSLLLTRRGIIGIGCLMAAGAPPTRAATRLEVAMRGTADGARVWFEPVGVHIAPGTIVRWTNHDAGNAHTATAYHPANDGHPLRIPPDAAPWNSDYLLPQQHFEITLTVAGVYDYFCQPHEHAGMAGRIVVGTPPDTGFWSMPAPDVPPDILATLPAVALIMKQGRVERPVQG